MTDSSPYGRFMNIMFGFVDKPVTVFREKIVEPIRGKDKQHYYHRQFRRVPTIDQCDVDDPVCFFEANEQYKRDKAVDENIVSILRSRRLECEHYYGPDAEEKCAKQKEDYETASTNYFIKYGDMGPVPNVRDAYMKQKHRLIWERRHGPVGSTIGVKE